MTERNRCQTISKVVQAPLRELARAIAKMRFASAPASAVKGGSTYPQSEPSLVGHASQVFHAVPVDLTACLRRATPTKAPLTQ